MAEQFFAAGVYLALGVLGFLATAAAVMTAFYALLWGVGWPVLLLRERLTKRGGRPGQEASDG